MCINPNLITYRKVLAPLKDILMVDNQYDIVDVLQIRFQKEGFRVYGFTDPVLALGYLKADPENLHL